jgi:hypothetical protein
MNFPPYGFRLAYPPTNANAQGESSEFSLS